ncbi:MAG: ABC transporter ATP-binding protein [Lachnospiraceae bacterium]|nr:ABC transporter ATP-binding protein [Lachnospiraceae bacterium]
MGKEKREIKKDKKEKKKKLPIKRTISNNLFALKMIWNASPIYLVVYIGSSFVYGILGFLSETYLLRRIVNGIDAGEDIVSIVRYVVTLALICIGAYLVLSWFFNVVSPIKSRRVGAYVEKMLFRKASEVELACYETPSFYDKYVKAMDEAYDRMLKVMYTLDGLVSRIIALTANSILLFSIDPLLIVFGLFPLLLGFFRRLEHLAHHALESEKKPIKRRAEYVKRTFYLGEYAKEMRIGGMYQNMLRDLADTYEEYKKVIKKNGTRKAIYGYVQRVGLDVVTILGATLYSVWSTMCVGKANGGMSVGDCLVVLGSIGTISYCLNNLMLAFTEFGEHALFLDDVRFFLDYESTIVGGDKTAPADGGDIEVRNLNFRYEGSEQDTLKDINFVLHKGERIALVGSNGSGKTTLVKLLLRLYDPTEGEILFNNKNIKEYSLNSYRDCFSTVFQDFKMFSMSVKDNVLLRPAREGDDELVKNALVESGAAERVERFDNGLDTILTREFDDKGENLSIGEQQKLSLARVFADYSPVVLLDEPSSALDPIAEYTMFENMMRATNGRSVVFISHRLSSAVLADRVILMEDGRIAECGTHEELMKKNGKYAAMFNRQAENYLGNEVSANE